MFTNYGAQAVAWAIGSDISNNYVQYCAIGSGSGTVAVTQTTLLREFDRNIITGSPNFTTARKVTFTADFGVSELSGTQISEIGFLASGASLVGSMWHIERFGSIAFDGTNELQAELTIHVLNA